MREEEKRMKEEEERKKKEEKERLKKEKEENERKRKEEEERRKIEEEKERLAKEAEAKRIEREKQKAEEERKLKSQLTARSIYEQALSKKGVEKSGSGDKVVTLRKGTINDIRNKIFERKAAESEQTFKKAVPKKHIIADKEAKEDHKENKVSKKEFEVVQVPEKVPDAVDILVANVREINETLVTPAVKTESQKTDNEPAKKVKRQSFINDFAALEKTYRMLGIYKDPVITDDEIIPEKKRHASEGREKKKTKTKTKMYQITKDSKAEGTQDIKPSVESVKPKLANLDTGISVEKRNFFQEMINEKKGIVNKEVALNGPKLRKKTDLVSTFEERRSMESAKRHSLVKEEVKVMFSRLDDLIYA